MFIPKLSICTITYMHAEYISQTIEGVLMQKVNFPIEFIIADDCSTDNTNEIVSTYINDHPNGNWIKYTKHPKNMGMNPNFAWAIQQCKGEYIAICEGDDYWTDPLKLQKQVDILENDSSIAICAHRCDVNINNKIVKSLESGLRSTTFKEVLMYGLGADTLSVVFRNMRVGFPKWFFECEMGDYPLFLLLLKDNQRVSYMSESMGVYRKHDGGVWSSLSNQRLAINGIKTFEIIDKAFGYKYHKYIKKAIVNRKRKFGQLEYTFIAVLKQETPIKYLVLHLYHKLIKSIKFKSKKS